TQDRVCAFNGDHADDLSIDNPRNPLISPQPSREHSPKNSATRSSNARGTRRADRPPLKTSLPNPRVSPDASMDKIPIGAGHTIDSTPMTNASLGHVVNLLA
ncbi:hypothetical protein AMTR_s00030p00221300, partial [Amborella trichopoda]